MIEGFDQFTRATMSGARRGAGAAALRAGLRVVEPFYSNAARLRNRLFDSGLRAAHKLPRPVISIGNITTGGTGKTPMVRRLASRLRDEGRRVAVLSRGYKSRPNELGDEQLMLDRLLNTSGKPAIPLKANPSRLEAARQVLVEQPATDVFLLDDGFQHRTVARDLDIVLINAAEPFGYDHVLPRGMLREPLGGLRRADAIVLTHVDRVDDNAIKRIQGTIRRHNPRAQIYRTVHAPTGLRTASTSSADDPDRMLDELRAIKFFAFCGIATPDSFDALLKNLGRGYIGHRWFKDHHDYSADDLRDLRRSARGSGAQVLVTTEKDWVKLENLPGAREEDPQIWRMDVGIQFLDDDEWALLNQIRAKLDKSERRLES